MTLLTPATTREEEQRKLYGLGERLLAMPRDDLSSYLVKLDPRDLALAERAIAAAGTLGWRSSPSAMANHLDPTYKRWRYVELLSQRFVDAFEGRSIRQIWNLPARYGKSKMASQWGPVWALDRDPMFKIALTSYGDELADENSRSVRDLLVRYKDDLRVRLLRDRARADRFKTDQGGGLIAAGVGSGLTGFGADGIIIDDPFKNWQEAHSPARRKLVFDWYRSVVRLRLEQDISFIILVMTRWHEEDLAGLLEAADIAGDGEGWDVLRLPALAEAPSTNQTAPPSQRQPDALGREPGEPLEPDRFSEEAVRARARALGSYLTTGMEQQRPSPEEGDEIKREWWEWADDAPPKFDNACTSWDMKLKDKKGGDYVVGQAWGRTGKDCWCVDQLRGQWNLVTTKTAIVLMAVRHPEIRRHVIENTGNGPEVIEQLRAKQEGYEVSEDVRSELGITDDEVSAVNDLFRRGVGGIIPENPKGDKVARARAQTPFIEAGDVHLLDRPWAHAIVDECAAFPNGAHDDQVDAMSQALKKLQRRRRMSGATAADVTEVPGLPS